MLQQRSRDSQCASSPRASSRPSSKPTRDYLSAWEEDKYIIAQANVGLDQEGNIVNDLVNARQAGNFVLKHRDEIEYMDVSPKQLVSVAASSDSVP